MKKTSNFQLRAMISVLLALAFPALLVSGLVLFVSPPGRVANWTDWRLFGLSKHAWGGLHIWFGLVFAASSGVHLFYNWRVLLSYFRKRRQQIARVRPEWIVSAALALLVFGGTSLAVPPFVSLLDWNESIKESWDRPAERAPIPHAELLTVAEIAEHAEITPQQALARLREEGFADATEDSIVGDLATERGISAQAVYAVISGSPGRNPSGPSGGGGHGLGMGNLSLKQFCIQEGIALEPCLDRLAAEGIVADADLPLRDLARANGFSRPYELVAILRGTK